MGRYACPWRWRASNLCWDAVGRQFEICEALASAGRNNNNNQRRRWRTAEVNAGCSMSEDGLPGAHDGFPRPDSVGPTIARALGTAREFYAAPRRREGHSARMHVVGSTFFPKMVAITTMAGAAAGGSNANDNGWAHRRRSHACEGAV